MHDDDMMDQLLRDALSADVPRLSSGFDARVLRRVRPRRLTPIVLQPIIWVAVLRRQRGKGLIADVRCAIPDACLDVERLVERDAIDPRAEFCLAPERTERMMHTHHHVLRHVFGIRRELLAED